jgi:osmoprotectant transport system permease protein
LIANRVLGTLVVAGAIAASGLGFLTVAPNRLVLGVPVAVIDLADGWRGAIALPALLLCVGVFLKPTRRANTVIALTASVLLVALIWLAGDGAARRARVEPSLARIALGGGFWVLLVATGLAFADALRRLRLRLTGYVAAGAAVAACVVALLALGQLDQLSLMKEYANRRDAFHAAVLRHLQIVGATLVPTLLIGLPLGVTLFRSERLAKPVFAVLNVIQTLPSIALFALLIAPLALLATTVPWLGRIGIGGIGLAPTVVALTLYSLLPVVRATVAGLGQVPMPVVEAAAGMGLTSRQIFWKVQLPIALPLLLAGIRIMTVQAIGLAVVAALIGAGGLGAIMFQGLLSTALDLVLLGVLPVVALAVAADAAFMLLAVLLDPRQR